MMERGCRILIAGGGIAGLCLAHTLLQAGFRPEVFEQDLEPRTEGGLGIYRNALLVLEHLGLLDDARRRGNEVLRTRVRDPSGRLVLETDSPKVVILRKDLHEVLSQSLPPGLVHAGERLKDFEERGEGIRVHFESGRAEDADLLVGADGFRSRVCSRLFGPQPVRYANFIYRGLAPRPVGTDLCTMEVVMGRGSKYHQICLSETEIGWSITTNEPERREPLPVEQIRERLLRSVTGWDGLAGKLIGQTASDHLLQHPVYLRRPLAGWSRGHVVLLGDAAHPQHPALGQGACMAMESAAVLGACLAAAPDMDQALRDYQRIRKARIDLVLTQSTRMAHLGQWEHPLACAWRNRLLALATRSPRSFGSRIYRSILMHDVYAQIRDELGWTPDGLVR